MSEQQVIVRRDDDGSVNDVVIRQPRMMRAEMMSDTELWLACYIDDNADERVEFWVRAVKRRGQRMRLEFKLTDNTARGSDA